MGHNNNAKGGTYADSCTPVFCKFHMDVYAGQLVTQQVRDENGSLTLEESTNSQ